MWLLSQGRHVTAAGGGGDTAHPTCDITTAKLGTQGCTESVQNISKL